ncbi:MAG: TolC family protein [Treponema sp.]|jgi:outer membrane protein TolC|nr:TolC family protein [Treponema sp.]
MRKEIAILICLCSLVSIVGADSNRTLTFSEAADLAIASSAELKHSRASQALMEGAWMWGLRSYFPRLSISASENDRLQQIGPDSFIKNYGIGLDQLVFDGGKTTMARNLERIELNIYSSNLNRMASEIGESAISAYRSVLSSRAILEIRKSALTVLEEQRRILNEEVLLGLALPVDLATADINLADTKLGILSIQLDLTEMEKQFAELLGLNSLPELTEKVDVNQSLSFPTSTSTVANTTATIVAALARERNPELVETRFSITKKQAELKYASNTWIPTLRLSGNFGLSGQDYPLTRYNWAIGLNIEFTSPWFQNQFGAQAGWEPPHDRTAMMQNNFTPLPDPASGIGKNRARLALAIEQEKYNTIIEQLGRIAHNAIEKCALAEQKRILAFEAAALGVERCRIEEIRLELGQITRIKLMETLIEQTQREIAVIEAATALLEAERELEKFLDLKPGELVLLMQHKLLMQHELPQQRRN